MGSYLLIPSNNFSPLLVSVRLLAPHSPVLSPSRSHTSAGRLLHHNSLHKLRAGRLNEDVPPENMESYLGDLSLEYDSVWDTKPAWCQPWTIVSTGLGAVVGSWVIFHQQAITVIASLLIAVWWYTFLYAYPLAYSNMIAERRKRVFDGDEDSYGRENTT